MKKDTGCDKTVKPSSTDCQQQSSGNNKQCQCEQGDNRAPTVDMPSSIAVATLDDIIVDNGKLRIDKVQFRETAGQQYAIFCDNVSNNNTYSWLTGRRKLLTFLNCIILILTVVAVVGFMVVMVYQLHQYLAGSIDSEQFMQKAIFSILLIFCVLLVDTVCTTVTALTLDGILRWYISNGYCDIARYLSATTLHRRYFGYTFDKSILPYVVIMVMHSISVTALYGIFIALFSIFLSLGVSRVFVTIYIVFVFLVLLIGIGIFCMRSVVTTHRFRQYISAKLPFSKLH